VAHRIARTNVSYGAAKASESILGEPEVSTSERD